MKLQGSKLHKTLNILFRLMIVALSLGFIYRKLFAEGDFEELSTAFQSFYHQADFFLLLVITLIMMLVNWGIEALKWKKLVARVENIGFLQAVQSVISGVTVSIFTPNRTGEFIGRAFILRKGNPGQAVLLTLIGSFSQLLVTILAGLLALAFSFREYLPDRIQIPSWSYTGVIMGIILIMIAGLILFFRISIVIRFIEKRFLNKFSKLHFYLNAINTISGKELLPLFFLSMIRYLVFSIQFFLVLKAFGLPVTILDALTLIPVIFLSLAIIPTIALSELGVRGSVSLFFIGEYLLKQRGIPVSEQEALGAVLAAGLLWVINLAVPAIAGIPFVFKLKFFRR